MSAAEEARRDHRLVAERFTAVVAGTTDWDAPSPVASWTARDVVGHLVDWLGGFLSGGAGIDLPQGPPVSEDPAGAWRIHVGGVQALLEDPATESAVLSNPHIGEVPVPDAIARFYLPDVFMHTWDLARATGQDDNLDPERCAQLLGGMEPMEEMLRASGQYGPRVDVPAGASVQDRLIGFIGRDPAWRP